MWDAIFNVLREFGLRDGVFVIFFIGAHWWLFRISEGRLTDLRRERDRLAAENREYRNKFQHFTDKMMELNKGVPAP